MKSELEKLGYQLESTFIGWWVDGAYGYLVSGYWPSKEKAIFEATAAVESAISEGRKPAWLFDGHERT